MNENYILAEKYELLNFGGCPKTEGEFRKECYFTNLEYILSIYKKRAKFVSKYDFGHALIIAGSYGQIGAALLATKACLRSGAGLTSSYSPTCAYTILQTIVPEAMCVSDKNNSYISMLPNLSNYNAIAIGCGIGLHRITKLVVKQLLSKSNVAVVIDADAINVLADDKLNLRLLKPNTILTPHIKEFERLTKPVNNDYERLILAIQFAKTYEVILVLKGVNTAIINSNGKVYFNTTGNQSLAKGGSGDTLTGIIVAHLAKGYSPLHAAILGVYFHGLAADICIKKQSIESVIATDLIEALKEAFLIVE
jgi:hydroxyethylthiazole kinase-like uncharacterized protein yjeF